MIDESIQQTRSLMTDLSPPVLYELGLTAAIQWLCEQIQAQHNLQILLMNDFKIQKVEEEEPALAVQSDEGTAHEYCQTCRSKTSRCFM